MIKLQVDEYENLMDKIGNLHKESIEFANAYVAEFRSTLMSDDGFHTELVSGKLNMLLDVFQNRLVPELKDMFESTEREIESLGENVSEADEEGRLNIRWEE